MSVDRYVSGVSARILVVSLHKKRVGDLHVSRANLYNQFCFHLSARTKMRNLMVSKTRT